MVDNNNIIDSNDFRYNIFCKTYNCIYCITCGCCGMQYVGQTKTQLNLRVNVHRNHINKNTVDNTHQVEYDHFKLHDFKKATISILNIQRNHSERLMTENMQIVKKNTIYPYGLNQILYSKNMVRNNLCIDKNSLSIYDLLQKQKRFNQKRLKRGKKKKYHWNYDKETTIIKSLEEKFNQDYNVGTIKNYMLSKTKKCIQNVVNIIQNGDYKKHFKHLLIDLAIHRIQHLKININILNTQQQEKSYCVIKFNNKIMNNINFNKIFDNNKKLFPIKNMSIKRAYKYGKTIGRKLFNYNQVAKNFKGTPKEIQEAVCSCEQADFLKYVNSDYGHIITGDINIVKNNTLRKYISYGTKYRINTLSNSKYIEQGIYKDLLSFINKMSEKWSIPNEFFTEWKQIVYEEIKMQFKKNNYYETSNSEEIKLCINDLQKQFIITYADKAPNNFTFICKKFYLQNLLTIFNNNDTYEMTKECGVAINKKIVACYKRIKNTQENLYYPYLVLIPKHHKKPLSFRTVTMGHNTYNSKANKLLLQDLKKMEDYIIKHHNYIFIKNSMAIKDKIKEIVNTKKINRIQTYDVKDLFNNLEQEDIYNIINELYQELEEHIKFNMDQVKFEYLLKLVIFNNYLKMGGAIYKQVRGLQQGMICSTIVVNLTMFQFERRNCKINTNYILRRYLDDIICFYLNEEEEEINLNAVYPNYIQIIKSLDSKIRANFLDLDICIENGKITTDIYYKQNDMPFNMIKMQHFTSCIHKSIFTNIIYNGMIRIHALCTKQNIMKNLQLLKQNAKVYGYKDEVFNMAKKKMSWKSKKKL